MTDTARALPNPALAPRRPRAAVAASWRDYVTLTKPRIMSLLVLTSVCAMVTAAHGAPAPGALVALVLGGALACGGASALNHVLDRDIDRLMGPRTASRPVAAGRISPARATGFGVGLTLLSFAVLAAFTNLLAAALSLAGGAFEVALTRREFDLLGALLRYPRPQLRHSACAAREGSSDSSNPRTERVAQCWPS